jgi:hypothetical protein
MSHFGIAYNVVDGLTMCRYCSGFCLIDLSQVAVFFEILVTQSRSDINVLISSFCHVDYDRMIGQAML